MDKKTEDAEDAEDDVTLDEKITFKTERMVTIEPIIDFDLNIIVDWIKRIKPKWVNIGADSKGHKLPEPSKEKIEALIKELKKFTEVRIKPNLNRLIK